MQIVARLDFDPQKMLDNHGLGADNTVQKHIDSACMRYVAPYMPFQTGVLESSMTLNTEIGSGWIVTATPYARYLYYGKLMVDPITGKGAFHDPISGRFWSRPNTPKVLDPNGRELDFDTSKHPKAGKLWFERMKADHLDDIGEEAAMVAGGKFIK